MTPLNHHRPLRRTAAVAATAGAVGAAGVGGLALTLRRLARRRTVNPDRLPPQDVALVLGAEAYLDGTPSRFLRARLDLAADLYRRRLAQRLLLSGDSRTLSNDETGTMRSYLLGLGVPDSALLVDPAGFDTYDSCLRARDVFGVRRLVVVTQSYHLPRALATCRALGIDAWGVGDESVRANSRRWSYGVAREVAANLKFVWDVVSRRPARAGCAQASRPA